LIGQTTTHLLIGTSSLINGKRSVTFALVLTKKIVNAGKRTHNFQLDCSIQQNFDESLSLSYSVWVYSRHKRLGTAIIADGLNEQNECVTDLD